MVTVEYMLSKHPVLGITAAFLPKSLMLGYKRAVLGKRVFDASPIQTVSSPSSSPSPLDKKISSPSPGIEINSSPCVTIFFLLKLG